LQASNSFISRFAIEFNCLLLSTVADPANATGYGGYDVTVRKSPPFRKQKAFCDRRILTAFSIPPVEFVLDTFEHKSIQPSKGPEAGSPESRAAAYPQAIRYPSSLQSLFDFCLQHR
jgi:hypothetical protein